MLLVRLLASALAGLQGHLVVLVAFLLAKRRPLAAAARLWPIQLLVLGQRLLPNKENLLLAFLLPIRACLLLF
jgi:hypothetical protein